MIWKKNQDYIKLCHENNGRFGFDTEREKVEKIKLFLEKTVGKQSSPRNQVIEALILLNRMKTEEEKNICYALIIKGYSNQWKQSQLAHFNKYDDALRKNYDYFLSFTDRNLTPGYDNYINVKYKYLIKSLLGQEFKKANQKDNLLALAIHYLLKSSGNKKGFFYPQKQGDSQEVEEKLKSACENCFVFIQLIQNIMFTSCNETNYCYFEYCHARQCLAGKKGFIFLLAEKSHDSLKAIHHDVYFEYDEWYCDILRRDNIILEPTEKYNQKHISKLLDIIRKNLVDKIDKIKWSIIEDVP